VRPSKTWKTVPQEDCAFCRVVQGLEPPAGEDPYVERLSGAIVFEPLKPVAKGHVLVVPHDHAERLEYLHEYRLARLIMEVQRIGRRLELDKLDYNVIQSNGPAATQTVPHVHFHVIPRRPFDGLQLPWTT
jgi:diadenosine tetraphosphate (Ap4A) HIT family hydrolase